MTEPREANRQLWDEWTDEHLESVVTGVDFSPKAIATARELAAKIGQEATFVESSIEELPDRPEAAFDIVFTSAGVLCRLGDLGRWAEVIRHFLVPERAWSYFTTDPVAWPNEGSYTGATPDAKYDHRCGWMHSVSEIVMSLIRAGLTLEEFIEHPSCGYREFPFLVEGEDGNWRTPEGCPDLPMSMTIRCRG